MSPFRFAIAHLLIFWIVAGSFYDILRRDEHWPFSNYPMFAQVHRQRVLNWYRMFGVTHDNREVPIVKYSELWPLDQSRLSVGLRRVHLNEGNGARLRDAVADTLQRYEERRIAGKHKGPALQGMRLYRVRWTLQPYGANLHQPDSRQLLADVSTSSFEARR